MAAENVYTESEVNKMLGDQRTNIRLDSIEEALRTLTAGLTVHTEGERQYAHEVKQLIAEGGNDRRQCEARIKQDLVNMNDEHHRLFVKKTDLKMYASIIILTVTATTGFIAWLGSEQASKDQTATVNTILRQVEVMLNDKIRP